MSHTRSDAATGHRCAIVKGGRIATMPIMPSAVVNEAEIDRRVKEVARKLAPDVVRIRYALTLNSTGEESIFLRIVLSDLASTEKKLPEVTGRVRAELRKEIDFAKFGLYTYFNFRSRSEQAQLKEPAWS
jgi:hypothetical protein